MMTSLVTFDALNDDQLLTELKNLFKREKHTSAELISTWLAVDARRLFLREWCSSLFTYCTQVLHLDEGAAYNRIEIARAARRVPALLEAIGDGSLTLSSARLLAPHLTLANYGELLDAARRRSKREVEALIARLAPRPAVATVLRKVPVRPSADLTVMIETNAPAPALTAAATTTPPMPVGQLEPPQQHQYYQIDSPRTHSRNSVAPLSADTYKLQVTISVETQDKLRRARDLLRHS